MDLYRENILDHYKNPRNFGTLDGADVTEEEVNLSCGDHIIVDMKLRDTPKGRVVEIVRFRGEGCAIHRASASMLSEKITGMRASDVLALNREDVENLLGTTLTPSRVKCAVLPLEAMQQAVQKSEKKV